MAQLLKPYEAYEKPGLIIGYAMSAIQIYKGSMIGLNPHGYVVPMDHGTDNLRFVGIASESADNSTGEHGDKKINVIKAGSFVYRAVPQGIEPMIATMGMVAFAHTGWEVKMRPWDLCNEYQIGRIVGIETTSTGQPGVRVRIDNHVH